MWKYPDLSRTDAAYVEFTQECGVDYVRQSDLQGVMGYRNAHQFNQRVFINSPHSR